MQTRASVNSIIQARLVSGGPNALQAFKQNVQAAQAELTNLKNQVLKAGGNNSETNFPGFKPNNQKTKTFAQRLEYGANFQFAKNNQLVPTTADIGVNVGYKLNDKSLIGIGISYKMGIGSLQHIKITHQGLGFRSFIDWKLKKQFYVSGGYEVNYNAQFRNISQLTQYNDWQQAGLLGISMKVKVKTKWVKGTKLQLLYDFLYHQHTPVSQPIIFRIGYDLK